MKLIFLAILTLATLLSAYQPTLPLAVVGHRAVGRHRDGLWFSTTTTIPDPPQFQELERSIHTLLDQAVCLHGLCRGQERSLDSIREQLSSLIVYLATRKRRLPSAAETWALLQRRRLANDINQAMLRPTAPQVLDDLVQEYRIVDGKDFFNSLKCELQSVAAQLSSFENLLRAVVADSTPSLESTNNTFMATQKQLLKSAGFQPSPIPTPSVDGTTEQPGDDTLVEVDVAIVGSGLGALCAGAILNTLYGKKVGIYESHYLAGGCAHAFQRKASNGLTFTFDSGPSILLGCSTPPFNALQQILQAVDQKVEWISYDGWGVIEKPKKPDEQRWKLQLGPNHFEQGPLLDFGGESAVRQFRELQDATKGLLTGTAIPAMAMRADDNALFPLLRYFPTLVQLIWQGDKLKGTFQPFMDGPLYKVTNTWLRNWLDALAFSLSGLPATRTAAAAMAFVLSDMHRSGATLDYPKGGMGEIVNSLVRGVEQGTNGSKVHLRSRVASIDTDESALRITGLTLADGKRVRTREGVICNAPVWSLNALISDDRVKRNLNNRKPYSPKLTPQLSWKTTAAGSSISLQREPRSANGQTSVLSQCDESEMTGSFIHLHLAIKSTGLDPSKMEAHYTVMDRSLGGDGSIINGVADGPCGAMNMIAVSNPCVIDSSLAPSGYMVLHAYAAANEPYELWENLDRRSDEYQALKEQRAGPLWRAVESIIPDIRERVVLSLIGSPLTHERFLQRPRGSYGSATEDYLANGSTPYPSLRIANDGVFPGIGVPSVAIVGASAANSFVSVMMQCNCLDKLQRNGKL